MRSSQLPAGQREVRLSGDSFEVDGPVDLDFVKVENPPGDALVLMSRATGKIGRIEIDTRTTDGIKVQNADVNAAHDLQVLDGYVRCHAAAGGAHQDGIQVMGGARLLFKSILFEGADTQGIFVNRAGSGATTPTDIVFEDCKVGCANDQGGPATPVNINVSVRTVLRNCEVWRTPRFDRGIVVQSGAIGAVVEGNVEHAINAPGCDGEPGGGPDPEPDTLPLHVVSEDATTITLGWTPVTGLGYRFSRSAGGGKFSHTWDANRNTVRFSKDSEWYKVESLAVGPFGEHP